MTTDNAKPAVITAAEFVAGGYADKVAAGECAVVRDVPFSGEHKIFGEDSKVWRASGEVVLMATYTETATLNLPNSATLTVHWLPATASAVDADEVARLRAALINARFDAHFIREHGGGMMWSACARHIETLYNNLDTALNAAGETGEVEA